MNYKVVFQELRDAGQHYGELSQQGQELVDRANGIGLTQPDFGRIPWLQTRVFEAYNTHTQDCLAALQELSETLAEADQGLHSTADAYEEIEKAAEEAVITFFEGVGS